MRNPILFARHYWILCRNAKLQVFLNKKKIQDVNLDLQNDFSKRHDGSNASALKDRPRTGHLGFQELSRGGGHVEIRQARIKILE